MERDFEKSICLGSGISFSLLSFLISVLNGVTLVALYRDPLRRFRKTFSVFLIFIAAMDLFVGIAVCPAEAVMRLRCAFGENVSPTEGDLPRIMGYIGVNSSILLVTAMSVDRFVSVVCPYFYLRKVRPKHLVFCTVIMVVFSTIFASLQLVDLSRDVYILVDIHLHTTFPLVVTTMAYSGIFITLRKSRSRVDLQRQSSISENPVLSDIRRLKNTQKQHRCATTSFLILICLITCLVPYFVVVLIEADCDSCHDQKWLLILRVTSEIFLNVNSAVNPILTKFRLKELKRSIKVVLCGRENINNVADLEDQHLQTSRAHLSDCPR